MLFYIGTLAAVIYVAYRMVDGWVEKSVSVRREQNALLGRLIDTLERKGDSPESGTNKNETL